MPTSPADASAPQWACLGHEPITTWGLGVTKHTAGQPDQLHQVQAVVWRLGNGHWAWSAHPSAVQEVFDVADGTEPSREAAMDAAEAELQALTPRATVS